MIANTHPYEALFRRQKGDQKWFDKKPIVAWNDDGEALVVSDRHLVCASSYPFFYCIQEADGRVVAAIPGGGYLARYKQETGPPLDVPILAWLITEDGRAMPITSDSDGYGNEATESSNFESIIEPPDKVLQ
jgi:hypothetical protein